MQSNIVWADIGNTSVKWVQGLVGAELTEQAIDLQTNTTPLKEAESFINQVASSQATVHISCTAQNRKGSRLIQQLTKRCFNVRGYQRLEDGFELAINYNQKQEYGIDRYFSSLAVLDERSTLVVDWGTAITIDAWRKQYKHQGGWILAGQELYLTSFQELQLSYQPSVHTSLAKDTAESIGRGYTNLLLHWLNDLPKNSVAIVGFEVERFIMTGNGYKIYEQQLVDAWQVHKNLALKGLIKHTQ